MLFCLPHTVPLATWTDPDTPWMRERVCQTLSSKGRRQAQRTFVQNSEGKEVVYQKHCGGGHFVALMSVLSLFVPPFCICFVFLCSYFEFLVYFRPFVVILSSLVVSDCHLWLFYVSL